MPKTFTNFADARRHFDSCRSALLRSNPSASKGVGSYLVFSPAISALGHKSGVVFKGNSNHA